VTIFIPTVPHSGTWFLLELFKTNPLLHNVELGFVMFKEDHRSLEKRNVIHTHLHGNDHVLENLATKRGKMHDKLGRNFYRDFNMPLMDAMVKQFATVVPVRDPLASIVSRHRRHPEFAPHNYMIEGWLHVIRKWARDDIFYVPIDTELSAEERSILLNHMCDHCALKPWSAVEKWAEKWTRKNVTALRPEFAERYKAGDVDWIRKTFPNEWAQLVEYRGVLQPFLETLGYKDLLWW